jgi:site-specific recombinase XerD
MNRDVCRSLWRHAIRSPYRPSSLRLSIAEDKTPRFIGIEDWRLLRHASSNDDDNPQHLYSRLALELMYFGSLSVKEVADIQIDHIIRTPFTTRLCIPSRSHEASMIYLLPPVTMTLDRLGIVGATAASTLTSSGTASGAAQKNPSQRLFMSESVIRSLIKSAIHRAANAAVEEGNIEAASRLKSLTIHSLCRAFELHAREFDDANWIWSLIGAARFVPAVIRQYLPRRKELSELELNNAIRSLSPCWLEQMSGAK